MVHIAAVNDEDGHPNSPAVMIDDIKRFRQFDSKCPVHLEYGRTAGVETTTGPLGQGCGSSVGMAIAERWLAKHFMRCGERGVRKGPLSLAIRTHR
jgi:transketolase